MTIGILGDFLGQENDRAILEYVYKHHREWFATLSESLDILAAAWALILLTVLPAVEGAVARLRPVAQPKAPQTQDPKRVV